MSQDETKTLTYDYEHYESLQKICAIHNATLPPKRPPQPLHYTFYLSSGPNREQQREEQRRPAALKAKKNGPIRRMSRFNTTYREVKACVKQYSLRQHRRITVTEFIKKIKNA